MNKMKKILCVTLTLALAALAGCAQDTNSAISVVSREDGSGTRGAFIELFGIEQKDADGNKVDHTTDAAEVTNSTAVMMTTVAGNPAAIGYISLGSLNNTVKALTIDGAEASVENIQNGSYKIARPFNLVTGDTLSDAAQDFLSYILSDAGQQVVGDNGYIAASSGAFESAQPAGKVVVAGSSSVSPLMQKLIEAYAAANPNAEIELQQSDSTTGVTSAAEGLCDIGMASRELKESESAQGLQATVLAQDGIAVIVSPDNKVSGLTAQQVMEIFTGTTTDWSDVQ